MTRGRRLPSDGSARCLLAASAAQPRTPYVRVAGSPLRARASEQLESRAEQSAPRSPSALPARGSPPSPGEPGGRQRGRALAGRRLRTRLSPAAAAGTRGAPGSSREPPAMRAGLRGSPEQPRRGAHPRLGQGASC